MLIFRYYTVNSRYKATPRDRAKGGLITRVDCTQFAWLTNLCQNLSLNFTEFGILTEKIYFISNKTLIQTLKNEINNYSLCKPP